MRAPLARLLPAGKAGHASVRVAVRASTRPGLRRRSSSAAQAVRSCVSGQGELMAGDRGSVGGLGWTGRHGPQESMQGRHGHVSAARLLGGLSERTAHASDPAMRGLMVQCGMVPASHVASHNFERSMDALAIPLASAAFFTLGCALIQRLRQYADEMTPILIVWVAMLLMVVMTVYILQYQIAHGGVAQMALPDSNLSTIP